MHRFRQSRTRQIRVSRLFDGTSLTQFLDLVSQQGPFEGVRVVKVSFFAHFERQVRLVIVVGVLRNHRYRVSRQRINDFAHHSGFSRARTARNTYNQHILYRK